MSEAKKPMREAFPQIAAGLDSLRSAFGEDGINESMRAGMRGVANKFVVVSVDQVVGTQFDNPVRLPGHCAEGETRA